VSVIIRDRIGVVAVKHCNLTCRACNHLAPLFTPSFVDPGELDRQLQILSKHIHFEQISIQGGEPLLHPDIDELIVVAKKSGVADKVTVLTNGTLLHAMSQDFWARLDVVRLSLYPGARVQPIPEKWAHKVQGSEFKEFQEAFSVRKNTDAELVARIHAACYLHSRCHAIVDGYFYRCIVSAFIPAGAKSTWAWAGTEDGLFVEEGAGFPVALEAYTSSRSPLKACEYCVGTSGKRVPHKMLQRSRWIEPNLAQVSEMVDRDLLGSQT
jgi:GTP 3',8-cyclase